MNLTSTFRRIGEEIYRSYITKSDPFIENSNLKQMVTFNSIENLNSHHCSIETKDIDTCCQFLHSDLPQIRMISCLIILRTLNQGNLFKITL